MAPGQPLTIIFLGNLLARTSVKKVEATEQRTADLPEAPARSAAPPPAAGAPTDDGQLVRRCQEGSPTAFEELVGLYQDRVFNLVFRLAGHYEDAQDITQDVFLRAFEHIGQFRQQAQVYTWLFRIAVNLAISRCRRRQRVRFLSLDGGSGVSEGVESASSPTRAG